jgi:hypothetical protein
MFGGETYEPAFDEDRLKRQLDRVYNHMLSNTNKWCTLYEIREATGDPTQSISARLRDLRKDKFGGFVVEERRRGDPADGVHEYRLVVSEGQKLLNPKLSTKAEDHMTPEFVVEATRKVLGVIDLDPASSPEANELIQAARIFTREDDGIQQPWSHDTKVFLNPPGGALKKAQTIDMRHGYTKSRQALWWMKLMNEFEKANVYSAIFVGFSIEILQSAQALKCDVPQNYPLCVPRSRIQFDTWDGEKRVAGTQPTHANVIVCVSDDEDVVSRFKKFFRPIGEVFNDK